MFRTDIAPDIEQYVTLEGNYPVRGATKEKIENLVRWAQYKVALSELIPSERVFSRGFSGYKQTANAIRRRMNAVDGAKEFEQALEGDGGRDYLSLIRNLKHVRRWNRMNRFIESSVLAHTFLVALLALMFSLNREDQFVDETGVDPHYHSILLALFHDATEIRTGDILGIFSALMGHRGLTVVSLVPASRTQELLSKNVVHRLTPRELVDELVHVSNLLH